MEFVLGGLSTCCACLFSNPLEVAKTRMQLQGELQARGQYTRHYKNVAHAFVAIGKHEGLLALQKGLVPALWYQFVMNGVRLGTYQVFINSNMLNDANGKLSLPRCVAAGAFCGTLGGFTGSPLYLIKTQLQSQAAHTIAVGHQHAHKGFTHALQQTFKRHGILGLWRGVSAAMIRVTMGSASQLSTFSVAKNYLLSTGLFTASSWSLALSASMVSGFVVVMVMTPFDVISTRLYNQGTDANGRGLNYRGVGDCFLKMLHTEGPLGFYKGFGASYFRLGPHTVLSLVFWDQLRVAWFKFQLSMKNL